MKAKVFFTISSLWLALFALSNVSYAQAEQLQVPFPASPEAKDIQMTWRAKPSRYHAEVRAFHPEYNIKGKTGKVVIWADKDGKPLIDIAQPTAIDMKRDFALAPSTGKEYRVYFGDVRVSYGKIDNAGVATLNKDTTFNDHTFVQNTDLDTNVQLKYGSVSLHAPRKNGNYVDRLWDIKYFDITSVMAGEVRSTDGDGNITKTPKTVTHHAKVGLPALGVRFGNQLNDKLQLVGEVSGLTAGRYGGFYDIDVTLKGTVTDHVTFAAGYRAIKIDMEYDNDEIKMDMKGPYASLIVQF